MPMTLHEPAVTLTDYLLAVEAGLFSWWLARSSVGPVSRLPARAAFVHFFAAVALASVFGGTVHGFLPDPESVAHRLLWGLTLISIGAAALTAAKIGIRLLAPPPTRGRRLERLLDALCVGYVVVVLFVSHDFGVAIAAYLPATIFLLVVYVRQWKRRRGRALALGIAGLALIFAGAAIQQLGVGLHPVHFDHNAVYHVIQGIALYLLFRSALELTEPARRT